MAESLICGVDEAGRGPLAGPVFAAAVILDAAKPIEGLADSKVLSERKRMGLEIVIQRDALAYAIASASVVEIDQMNILQATLLAMRRAVEALAQVPTLVLVDGLHVPMLNDRSIACQAMVQGDATVAAISAASILAKNARDRAMIDACDRYPGYHFRRHKGYGTREHLAALNKLGPCEIHRQSFAPVRMAAAQGRLWKSPADELLQPKLSESGRG